MLSLTFQQPKLYIIIYDSIELDAVLGDCVVQITEHECCIMIKLIQYLQAHLTELANIVELAAELDWYYHLLHAYLNTCIIQISQSV